MSDELLDTKLQAKQVEARIDYEQAHEANCLVKFGRPRQRKGHRRARWKWMSCLARRLALISGVHRSSGPDPGDFQRS